MTNLNKPRKLASYVVDNHLYIHYYITINKLEVQERGKEMRNTKSTQIQRQYTCGHKDLVTESQAASFKIRVMKSRFQCDECESGRQAYIEDTTNADLDREAARSLTYSPEIAKAQTRNIEPWYLLGDE